VSDLIERLRRIALEMERFTGPPEMAPGPDAEDLREAADRLEALTRRVAELEGENARLRKVVARVAVNLGNGAYCSTDASIEFMEIVPAEVESVVTGLRARALLTKDNPDAA